MTAVALGSGWLADQLLGDPRRGHPVAGFGRAAAALERRLWADRRGAGAACTAALVGLPTVLAWAVDRRLARRGRRRARAAWFAAVVWVCSGGRSLAREARGVAAAVAAGDLEEARRRLPALVGRDPAGLDAGEVCRAVVESVADNTTDAVTGPLWWGLAAGPAGVVAHRCANTLDAMVGHRSVRYERFGWAAAKLDDLLGWGPARATVAVAALAAPLVGGDPAAALRVARRDAWRHPSPNAGPVEAAFAGALGVRLGGRNRYPAGGGSTPRVEQRGPLGQGPAPTPADVQRAVALSTAVGLGTVAGCAGAAALRRRRP